MSDEGPDDRFAKIVDDCQINGDEAIDTLYAAVALLWETPAFDSVRAALSVAALCGAMNHCKNWKSGHGYVTRSSLEFNFARLVRSIHLQTSRRGVVSIRSCDATVQRAIDLKYIHCETPGYAESASDGSTPLPPMSRPESYALELAKKFASDDVNNRTEAMHQIALEDGSVGCPDQDAYVLASKLAVNLSMTLKQVKSTLDKHPEIRRRKPAKNRLEVHAADFHRHLANNKMTDDPESIEERTAQIRAEKALATAHTTSLPRDHRTKISRK